MTLYKRYNSTCKYNSRNPAVKVVSSNILSVEKITGQFKLPLYSRCVTLVSLCPLAEKHTTWYPQSPSGTKVWQETEATCLAAGSQPGHAQEHQLRHMPRESPKPAPAWVQPLPHVPAIIQTYLNKIGPLFLILDICFSLTSVII